MSEKIEPAISAENWAEHIDRGDDLEQRLGEDWSRHALAAFALHDQPFGFTQEDVDTLRRVAPITTRLVGGHSVWQRLLSLADRIADLLPPREEQ